VSDRWAGSGSYGPGGGVRGFLSRVFGEGDNPLRWAVPLYRAWGITVKAHVFFLIFIAIELVRSLGPQGLGLPYMAMVLTILFGLVLLHEYGHCVACRRVGGEADEILLWPLGGLAYCLPPHTWQAHLVTVLGGPGVNAALLVPLGACVWAATGEFGAAVFNPFDPPWGVAFASPWLFALFALHYINLVLLLFNMLLPMYPMDAGRVLQCVLWRRMGYERALWHTASVGFVTAILLAVVALLFEQFTLLAVTLFGGLTCWQQKQSLKEMGAAGGLGGVDLSAAYAGPGAHQSPRAGPTRAQLAAIRKRQKEEAEVERLLAKIARTGMASLTRGERRFLDRVSQKKRDSHAG